MKAIKNLVNKLNPRKLFKATVPELEDYIGRTVIIPGEPEPIVIETIKGNMGMSLRGSEMKPHFYEINGKYLLNMLRFHAQMTGAKDITEDQFKAFEAIEFEAEKMPSNKPNKPLAMEVRKPQ